MDDFKVDTFAEIQKGSKVGKNCKISTHTFICEAETIENNVFIGHNDTFVNELYLRATPEGGTLQTDDDWTCIPTLVKEGAFIGSSAALLVWDCCARECHCRHRKHCDKKFLTQYNSCWESSVGLKEN